MADPTKALNRIDFDKFPRTKLCHAPTPIETLPRLTEHLGGPNLFIKRDDCTGLATGGNKTRKLEFLVGEAIQQKADMLVTQGAVQAYRIGMQPTKRLVMSCLTRCLERRMNSGPRGWI